MSPEFSRNVRVDTIGATPRPMEIAADPGERAALAARFGLLALDRLEAAVALSGGAEEVLLTGRVIAEGVQSCVVTGSPISVRIDEPFALRLRPDTAPRGAEEEVELGDEELDVIFYDGALVDVGEAVAQTLALALDPYPRAADAADALRDAGVIGESEAGPFGALAGLRDKLTR